MPLLAHLILSVVVCLHEILLSNALGFVSWPGVQRTTGEIGSEVNLTWTTDFDIYFLDHVTLYDPTNETIFKANAIGHPVQNGTGHNDPTITYIGSGEDKSTKTFILIFTTSKQHGNGNYTMNIYLSIYQKSVDNSWAVLYTYGKPTNATLNVVSLDAVEHTNYTLKCNSTSTSQPAEYRPDPPLVYSWYRDDEDITHTVDKPPSRHLISGDTLTLTDVRPADGDVTYSCRAAEVGGLTSERSEDVKLNVVYKPRITSDIKTQYSVPTGDSFMLTIKVSANPMPNISRDSTTFIRHNTTIPTPLPENIVEENFHQTLDDVTDAGASPLLIGIIILGLAFLAVTVALVVIILKKKAVHEQSKPTSIETSPEYINISSVQQTNGTSDDVTRPHIQDNINTADAVRGENQAQYEELGDDVTNREQRETGPYEDLQLS